VLLKQLPALTKFYGLTPRDVEDMSLREIIEYQDFQTKYQAEEARNS
jgi:hypothetical protein